MTFDPWALFWVEHGYCSSQSASIPLVVFDVIHQMLSTVSESYHVIPSSHRHHIIIILLHAVGAALLSIQRVLLCNVAVIHLRLQLKDWTLQTAIKWLYVGITIFCNPHNFDPSHRICCFVAEMNRVTEIVFFFRICPILGNTLWNECIYLAVHYQQLAWKVTNQYFTSCASFIGRQLIIITAVDCSLALSTLLANTWRDVNTDK